jgi:hypothetical protein
MSAFGFGFGMPALGGGGGGGGSSGDPFWPSVQLMVQDGVPASTTQVNLGAAGGSAVMSAGASFTAVRQVFGMNTIAVVRDFPTIAPFTSSGPDSVYSRAAGLSFTLESWFRYETLQNSTNGIIFRWDAPGGVIVGTLVANRSDGRLQWSSTAHGSTSLSIPSLNAYHFAQVTCNGDALTVDIDGVEVYAAVMGSSNVAGTYSMYVAAISASNAAPIVAYLTPFRFTRGVARPRGSIPIAAFPTSL